jgi:phosphate acetyltransferase
MLFVPASSLPRFIENRTFDEMQIGDSAELDRSFIQSDIGLFANVSGDVNPSHLDQAYADRSLFHGIVAHGMLGGSLFSAVLGTILPRPGTIYLGQDLRFRRPVKPGDSLTVKVTVRSKDAAKNRVVLDCLCTNQHGDEVITGTAEVIAPTEKIRRERMPLPEVSVVHHAALTSLMQRASLLAPLPTAIVHPCDHDSLEGVLQATAAGFIEPVLVGPEDRIRALALAEGFDLTGVRIVDAPHSHAAAEIAAGLARDGIVKALMKGSLHIDEPMHEVMRRENQLRTARRISHAGTVVTRPG